MIHGLTVCVGYADLLSLGMPLWMRSLTSLMVVTDHSDYPTESLCRFWTTRKSATCALALLKTDAFTRDGASFNKGLAMEEARPLMLWDEWVLFFDADIVPHPQWAEGVGDLGHGYLYGCRRLQANAVADLLDPTLPVIPDDRIGYGYFQLFRAKDPKIQSTPMLDTHWRHAGNADSNFLLKFGPYVKELPRPVWHLGAPHESWFGVGQHELFKGMMATRDGHGIHPSEAIIKL